MKKILFSLLFCAAFLSGLAQVPFNANLIIKSGTKDNLIVKGTDTLKLGWRSDRFQLRNSGNVRFADLIKSDSTVIIYNKLILESPNDTMLSVRGGGMNVINGSVLFSGTTGTTPVSGEGTRFMWIPEKAAFRAGYVDGTQWDDVNIGNNSFSGGMATKASGFASFAHGEQTMAYGDLSFAIGAANTAYGGASYVGGTNSISSGDVSFSTGTAIKANSYNLFACGIYNDTTVSTDKVNRVSTDPLFQIGNGTEESKRNDAFRILKNGKTYIGDSSSTTDAILIVDPTDSTSTFIGNVSVEKSLQVGNNTADTSLIVNGNLKADTIFGVTQMPYQSYVVRFTENLQWTNSGPLVVGETYRIDNLNPGDDFSNVGYMMPEMSFVATGTTPTNWSDGTYILNVTQSNPIVTVLYNSIGNVAWKYTGMKGSYRATFSESYDFNKIAIFPAIPTLPPLQVITQGLTTYEGVGFFLNSYLIDASLNSYQADGVFTDYMLEVRIYP